MDLLQTGIGVATGLAGGAVGGVLTAGRITRSGEKARARLAAEGAIRSTVTSYQATIQFDHDQVYEKSFYSKDYASLAGQEEFALALIAELPQLSRTARDRLHSELLLLVGKVTYALAKQRAHVPADRFDEKHESLRRALALTRILAEDEEIVDSRLDLLLKFQNEPQKHEASFNETIGSLDRMLGAVPVEDPRFARFAGRSGAKKVD